jgi:hypothetical protein
MVAVVLTKVRRVIAVGDAEARSPDGLFFDPFMSPLLQLLKRRSIPLFLAV